MTSTTFLTKTSVKPQIRSKRFLAYYGKSKNVFKFSTLLSKEIKKNGYRFMIIRQSDSDTLLLSFSSGCVFKQNPQKPSKVIELVYKNTDKQVMFSIKQTNLMLEKLNHRFENVHWILNSIMIGEQNVENYYFNKANIQNA